MKLRTHLIVTAGLGVALPTLLFGASSWALCSSSAALTRIHAQSMEPAVRLGRLDALLKNSRGHINAGYVHNPDIAASRLHSHPITLHSNAIRAAIKEVPAMWSDFSTRPHGTEEGEAIAVIEAGLQNYIDKTLQPAADALDAADYERAVVVVTTTFNSYRGIEDAIAHLQNLADARAKAEVRVAQTLLQRIGWVALASTLASMALGLGLVWAKQRSVRHSANANQQLPAQLRAG